MRFSALLRNEPSDGIGVDEPRQFEQRPFLGLDQIMTSHLSNPWTHAVAFLSMHFETQELSTGTCFFWRHDGRTYLVTNWHNLAGRNPDDCKPMSARAAIPDRIVFMGYKRTTAPDEQGFYSMAYVPTEIPLFDKDAVETWREHPTYGRSVDVAVLDITESVGELLVNCVNEIEADARLEASPSQDVFILGFPFGQIAGAPAPIWKHGTIALEPGFDPGTLPKLLIDTATRPGMSGSVVIARHLIVGKSHVKKDGTQSDVYLYAAKDLVLGIYSGRHYADLEKAQLGIAWKRRAIEETVATGRKPNVSAI